jgi:hypothetical protein
MQPTDTDVEAFLDAVPNEQRRADARELCSLLSEVTGEPPVLWPSGIVGFGTYHYRYDSGREGDAHRIAVAVRKTGISLYVLALTEDGRYLAESRADQFPRANVGKSCIRFKRLDDLDLDALRTLLEEAGRLPAPGAV